MNTKLIGPQSRVTLHFTLKLANGDLVDTTRDKPPATFTVGDGNLLLGFEQALFGLRAGESKELTIYPDQGFGQRNPENIQHMPRDRFADMNLEIGLMVLFEEPGQGGLPGIVTALGDGEVTVDFNHPLAGRTLRFEVEILQVE